MRRQRRDFLGRLVAWAGQHVLIRASLLTSTRASNPASVDLLSDYDVILYVAEVAPFGDRERWLPALGTVLVRMSPIEARVFDGLPGYSEGVIYDDGTKADFNIVPVELLRRLRLPPSCRLSWTTATGCCSIRTDSLRTCRRRASGRICRL